MEHYLVFSMLLLFVELQFGDGNEKLLECDKLTSPQTSHAVKEISIHKPTPRKECNLWFVSSSKLLLVCRLELKYIIFF